MAQWAAGERVTASKLSTTWRRASADAILALTPTETDIPGATITFTTTRDNVKVTVWGVFDVESIGIAANGVVLGLLSVDGVSQTATATWQGDGDENRQTVTQVWTVDAGFAGEHTIKLRGDQVGGADGENRINPTHTTITAEIEDNV